MDCCECGSTYLETQGLLQIHDLFVGPVTISHAHYYKCTNCQGLLYSVETAKAIDSARAERLEELLAARPIRDFVSATEAASMLGISRQAFSKNRRIRRGFIFQTTVSGSIFYLRESVHRFKQAGDGRFLLHRFEPRRLPSLVYVEHRAYAAPPALSYDAAGKVTTGFHQFVKRPHRPSWKEIQYAKN